MVWPGRAAAVDAAAAWPRADAAGLSRCAVRGDRRLRGRAASAQHWEPANLQLGGGGPAGWRSYVPIHGMLDEWSMLSRAEERVFRTRGARLVRRAAAIHCTAEAERPG